MRCSDKLHSKQLELLQIAAHTVPGRLTRPLYPVNPFSTQYREIVEVSKRRFSKVFLPLQMNF